MTFANGKISYEGLLYYLPALIYLPSVMIETQSPNLNEGRNMKEDEVLIS
jgi:hypothetical protein